MSDTDRDMYEAHLARMADSSPLRLASMRVLEGRATAAEILEVARWELDEAMCSLPPMSASKGDPRIATGAATRITDEDHASSCAFRAKSMLYQLERLLGVKS